jgi:hypothetical protein
LVKKKKPALKEIASGNFEALNAGGRSITGL